MTEPNGADPGPCGRTDVRPRLRDAAADRSLHDAGVVVLLDAATSIVPRLQHVFDTCYGIAPAGFHATMYCDDRAFKERVHGELRAILLPWLDALFEGHRLLLSNFVTKSTGEAGVMPPHQDWTFVDERFAASYNVWIPLVDVNSANGAMSLLPRGHRIPLTIRGTDTPNAFDRVDADSRLVEISMSAGDVLVHDHRVLHSSPANHGDADRVVAGCALAPTGVPILHYRQVAEGVLERFTVPERFYTDHTFGADHLAASAGSPVPDRFSQPRFTERDLPEPVEVSRHRVRPAV
ncbi:MAG: phytanoyl-CoA dioxygenase family protein [Microthrixaceae bacterium]